MPKDPGSDCILEVQVGPVGLVQIPGNGVTNTMLTKQIEKGKVK